MVLNFKPRKINFEILQYNVLAYALIIVYKKTFTKVLCTVRTKKGN